MQPWSALLVNRPNSKILQTLSPVRARLWSLKLRAGLAAGETVLVNGATGVAGLPAVQAARYLGARKVIAIGRNMEVLTELGADAVVGLTDDDSEVSTAFAAAAQEGIDIIIDYLCGHPTELLLDALAKAFRPEGRIGYGWARWARVRERRSCCPAGAA